jgi:hypothetical protein
VIANTGSAGAIRCPVEGDGAINTNGDRAIFIAKPVRSATNPSSMPPGLRRFVG